MLKESWIIDETKKKIDVMETRWIRLRTFDRLLILGFACDFALDLLLQVMALLLELAALAFHADLELVELELPLLRFALAAQVLGVQTLLFFDTLLFNRIFELRQLLVL